MRADLDQEIDRAVREMLDAEPRPDLRARVLERIAEPRRRWPLRWAVVPIAAAALLTLMIAAPWRASHNVSPFIRSTPVSQAVPAVRASLPRGLNRNPVEPTRTASTATRVVPAVRLARSEPATVGPEPLETLEAIDVPPVALTRLDGQPIAIPPLASIEQIEIQPVGPAEGRD